MSVSEREITKDSECEEEAEEEESTAGSDWRSSRVRESERSEYSCLHRICLPQVGCE